MLLGKEKAGGAGGFTWETDGAVVEVPDALGLELLSIGHAGFFHVNGPKPEEPKQVQPKPRKTRVPAEQPASLADALTTASPQPEGASSKA